MNFTKIKIKVPDLPTQFRGSGIDYSAPATKQANAQMIREIKANYGAIITRWGTLFEIPDGVIIAFIATESGGRMLAPNKFKATGLMQVTPDALWESVRKFQATTKRPLPETARVELNRQVPQIFTSRAAEPDATTSNRILSLLQRDANFNIMAGTIVLRWLLERFSTSITGGQLNKAMVAYNAGAYTRSLNVGTSPITAPIDTLILATNRIVPLESRSYLYKMMGKDGFLSLIYKDKVI